LGFLVDDVSMKVGFVFFQMTSSVDALSRFFGSIFLWILGCHMSL